MKNELDRNIFTAFWIEIVISYAHLRQSRKQRGSHENEGRIFINLRTGYMLKPRCIIMGLGSHELPVGIFLNIPEKQKLSYIKFSRIRVPDINVEKCLQFQKDELIWEVKQQCLAALPKVRKIDERNLQTQAKMLLRLRREWKCCRETFMTKEI